MTRVRLKGLVRVAYLAPFILFCRSGRNEWFSISPLFHYLRFSTFRIGMHLHVGFSSNIGNTIWINTCARKHLTINWDVSLIWSVQLAEMRRTLRVRSGNPGKLRGITFELASFHVRASFPSRFPFQFLCFILVAILQIYSKPSFHSRIEARWGSRMECGIWRFVEELEIRPRILTVDQEGVRIEWMSNVERFRIEQETVTLLLNKLQRHRGDTPNSRRSYKGSIGTAAELI